MRSGKVSHVAQSFVRHVYDGNHPCYYSHVSYPFFSTQRHKQDASCLPRNNIKKKREIIALTCQAATVLSPNLPGLASGYQQAVLHVSKATRSRIVVNSFDLCTRSNFIECGFEGKKKKIQIVSSHIKCSCLQSIFQFHRYIDISGI